MRPASRTAPRNSQLCGQRLVGGGEAKSGVQGDLQEPAGDRSLVGPPKPLRWVRPLSPRALAGTRRGPTSDALRLAGRQRLAGAVQQRVAPRRRGQGPHWFNISFSFQSIVPI